MDTQQVKRQAEILSKECGLPHSAALDLASRLNGFKDWHQAKIELDKIEVVTGSEIMGYEEPLDLTGKLEKLQKLTTNLTGEICFEMKVKAIAEVKTYFDIWAKNEKEAVRLAREKLDKMDNYEMDENADWSITYIHEDLGIKITNVSNSALKIWEQNDVVGLEETPVDWSSHL